MSTEKKEVTASKFGLVNIIMSMLNMGDAGKMESFFSRSIKFFSKEITKLESDLRVQSLRLNNEMDDLKDNLADAMEDLENAYKNVEPSRIENNAAQDDYRNVYFGRIEAVEDNIDRLNDQIKDKKTELKDLETVAAEDIQIRKDRIARIEKK